MDLNTVKFFWSMSVLNALNSLISKFLKKGVQLFTQTIITFLYCYLLIFFLFQYYLNQSRHYIVGFGFIH